MTGKRLLGRIVAVIGALCGFLLFLAVTNSQGTPIRPDVKKLINQPQQPDIHLAPARAGWNGPEMARAGDAPGLVLFGSASDAQAVRESLISAFVPDPRVVAFLAALILLGRQFRSWRSSHNSQVVPTGEVLDFPAAEHPQELHPAA